MHKTSCWGFTTYIDVKRNCKKKKKKLSRATDLCTENEKSWLRGKRRIDKEEKSTGESRIVEAAMS
jgi:hypothetical protein